MEKLNRISEIITKLFDLQCIHIPDSSSRHNDIMQSLFESPAKGVKIN